MLRLKLDAEPPYADIFYQLLAEVPQGHVEDVKLETREYSIPPKDLLARLLSFGALFSLKRLSVHGYAAHCLLDVITPMCNCIQSIDERFFDQSIPPPNPLPACTSCQDFSASHLPEIRNLLVELPLCSYLNLQQLARALAHRIDCSRPLKSVKIVFWQHWSAEKEREESESLLDWLEGKGDVIEVVFKTGTAADHGEGFRTHQIGSI